MQLSELPIGARLRDCVSDLVFVVADMPDAVGVTLISERTCTVACFDGAEAAHPCHPHWDGFDTWGNNSYALSNLHRWLNSDRADWFRPAHPHDAPPGKAETRYGECPNDCRPGFLSQFSESFRRGLVESDVPTLERTARGEGRLVHVKAKVYLPSRTEIGKGDESGFAEGKPLPVCFDPTRVHRIKPTDRDMEKYGRSWNPAHADAPLDSPQRYDPRHGWWYFLRTPSLQYGFLVRVMSAYGALSYTYANNDVVGIRPVCKLAPELEVTEWTPLHKGPGGVVPRLYALKPAESGRSATRPCFRYTGP